MPKRLPYEILLIGALALGSCGDSAFRRYNAGEADRLDVADVNARNAIARVADLESRVEELESKLNM